LGLQFNGHYSFELEPVSANIVSLGAPQSLSTMAHGVPEVLQWTINLDASIQPGEEVEWDMVANFNGSEYRQRVRKIYGEPTTHLQNSGSMADFLPSTNWGETTEDFASPTTSLTDSPFSEYENATVSELEYNRIIDLRHANWAQLTFQAKWEIEASWDYAQILASPVEDNTWTPLCARYTVEGGEYQDEGQPLWEGVQNQWLSEEVDLSDFLGQRIKVKFRLVSDQFVTEDGFYFDDLSVISLLEEGAPFPDTGYVDTIGSTPDTTTGMHSYAVQSSVIFPNPVSEWLHIRTPGTRTSLVKIWSHTGVLLLERKDHQGAIDVSSLPPGSYILTVERQDGRIDTHRVVVIR
jgi:carboxypeptidase T